MIVAATLCACFLLVVGGIALQQDGPRHLLGWLIVLSGLVALGLAINAEARWRQTIHDLNRELDGVQEILREWPEA